MEAAGAGEGETMMRVISLMYHDVVDRGAQDASGFAGPEAGIYKIERRRFEEHLKAIDGAAHGLCTKVTELSNHRGNGAPFCMTFDDGGESAATVAADMLEKHGWRGHFFITAGRIGTAGFVSAAQVRELHDRGHVIGSHSYSHPTRMSACTKEQLCEEWGRSVEMLSEIVGGRVTVASVCGGYYSTAVARAAEEAGIRFLFNSEPTSRCGKVGECLVLGRCTIKHWMPASVAAALARGRMMESLKQRVLWEAKKVTKMVGGKAYVKLSRALLRKGKMGAGGGEL